MSYADPSGYMFSSLRRHTKANLRGLGRNETFNGLVTLALSYVCGPCVSIYVGAQAYAVTGSLSEGIRAGVKSYATSLGHQLVGLSLDPGVGNAFANALVGGISAELSGGKFGHGFLAAGLVAGLKGPDSDFGIGTKPSLRFARVAIAAVVGGTVSELTGGKFRNGALTGAMTQLFNAENRIERDNNAQKERRSQLDFKKMVARLKGLQGQGQGSSKVFLDAGFTQDEIYKFMLANACSCRLSIAMNEAGDPIGSGWGFRPNGENLITGVNQMAEYMTATYGNPDIVWSGSTFDSLSTQIGDQQGILLFTSSSGAGGTNHATAWESGATSSIDGYGSVSHDAVRFWAFP